MSRAAQEPITKSNFVSALQCSKRFWIERCATQLLPRPTAAVQARRDEGRKIGELARQLFPGGIELRGSGDDWGEIVSQTRSALARRSPIFEAGFAHRDSACRIDILNPGDDGHWEVYEVKSSTGVKDRHLDDLAFQAHVIEGGGLEIERFYVIHLDAGYVRRGHLDPRKLFDLEEVTESVLERKARVVDLLIEQREISRLGRAPEVDIGPHCDAPHECPLKAHCWEFVGPGSVLELVGGKVKGFELLSRGVAELAEIRRPGELSPKQRLQVEAARSGTPYVDRSAVERFLAGLVHPLSFLDIETFSSSIPPFDNTSPYQQIPFMFSIHRVAEPEANARHFAYHVPPGIDPRPDFVRALANTLGQRGSVIAYNASFENRVLLDAAREVPGFEAWSADLTDRFVDLLQPFRAFDLYHPAQRGRTSLKRVLPAFTDFSYDELEIRDGETASREFLRISQPDADPVERARLLRQIEAYCSLDTLGMVALVERLRVA